jgi:hypothetical protein
MAHLSNASAEDFLRVKVIGIRTLTVLEEVGSPEDDDAAWTSHTVNLDTFAGQTIYLLIEAADMGDPSLIEAAIDDVLLLSRR